MKALKFIFIGMVLLLAGTAKSQVSISLNLSPPLWGPVGYDDARYYYLPDVESYYDVQASRFIYNDGGVWVHRQYLPARYRNYDLYGGYKVVMNDYRGDRPYAHFREYRTRYARGYRGHEQHNIGMRPEGRYADARYSRPDNHYNQGYGRNNDNRGYHNDNRGYRHDNENHNEYGNRHDNGNHYGNGNGNGHGKGNGGGHDKGNGHGNRGGHGDH